MTWGDEHPAFDPAAVDGLRAALDDDALLSSLTGSFLTETPQHISALVNAQRAGDLHTVSTTAHLIKGSALTFGASRLAATCAAIEASPAEAGTLVSVVEQEYGAFSRALAAHLGPLL